MFIGLLRFMNRLLSRNSVLFSQNPFIEMRTFARMIFFLRNAS